MVNDIPPLPSSVLTTILTHLLPPSPLPTELVSKVLLHRLLYLPPHPDDLDAHLTPLPSLDITLQPISSRLKELARAHKISDVQYSREEDVLARIFILPESESESELQGGIEVRFEFENGGGGGDGRGWVYHNAQLPTTDNLIWVDQPFLIPPPQLQINERDQQQTNGDGDDDPTSAPAGYWAAFDSPTSSSPSSSVEDDDDRGEDAYWAQYSRPETQPVTPGPGSNPQGLTYGAEKVDKDDPRKVAEAVTRSLNALKAERRRNRNGDEDEPTTTNTTTARDTLDKLRGKIGNILNAAWNEYKGDGLDKEGKALRWLSIAREVIDAPTFTSNDTNHVRGNIDEEVLRAKLQVLLEMYDLLDEEEDGFWRLVEGTIRLTGGETMVQDEVERQTTYYE